MAIRIISVPGCSLILYNLLEFGRATAGRLPAFLSYPIASAVGDVVYCIWPRGRGNMIKSIAAVLCQDVNSTEVRKTARYAMRNYCKSIVDMLRYAYPKEGVLEKDIDMIGSENLDNAFAGGKGVIIVSLHIGSLELGMKALSNAGYPINAVVHNLESGQTDRFIQKPRAHSGVKLISANKGILHMLDVLKRNEALALMIDSPGTEKGIAVKLGNKIITAPSGVAAMALRTGAKIIPCGLFRSTNTKFLAIICKPIEFDPGGNLTEDARDLTERTMRAIEQMARVFADQWYIFHPLIKDGATDIERIPEKVREGNPVI